MKLEPLYMNVLIDPMKEGDTTPGGLAIPAVATRKSPFQFGVVVAAGSGRINAEGKIVPLAVKAGDTVMFVRAQGTEIPVDDKTFVMLTETSIAGRVLDLPQKTSIMGVDGRLLQMNPLSRTITEAAGGAAPDVVYQNIDETNRAIRAGFDSEEAYTSED